ncbi:transposase, MuDR, MULE transposase domain protein [Artemisia annua]|uniref:Transposase, MuDR, MULE transposase domain protein n=1 Tax=Artemisia annua TaxID=35608 RepID=A0A2U1NYM5_ARTAN|nr:transposase, MuDR, MULE transposase domain protein [Artemisia annua]
MGGWQIRARRAPIPDMDTLYESYPRHFSIQIHHSGEFSNQPTRVYKFEYTDHVDLIDCDTFSMYVLVKILADLGLGDNEQKYKEADVFVETDVSLVEKQMFEHTCWRKASKGIVIKEILQDDVKGKQDMPCFEDDLFQQDDLDRPESCFVDRPEDVALMFDEYLSRNRDVNDRNTVQEVDEEVVEMEQPDDEEACDQNDEQQTEGDVSDFEHAARDMPTPDTPVDMGSFNFQLDANIQDNRREAAEKLHPVDAAEQEAPSIPMEELESADEADVEDGPALQKRRLKVIRRAYKGKYKIKEGYFRVHDEFVTRKEATDKIKMHALQARRAISVIQCDNNRVRAKCFCTVVGESSFNPIYAKEGSKPSTSKKRGRFEKTKKQKDLKCKGVSPRGHLIKNHKPPCPWDLLISKWATDNCWSVKTLKDTHKCIQTRDLTGVTSRFLSPYAIEILKRNRGDHKEQYAQLRDYAMELRAKNPGTTVKIQVETNTDLTLNSRVFKRIYVCIGQILTAVGIDGNNGIYPVAYAVVEAECKSSWLWFLKNLGDDLDLQPNYHYTFISDRQKAELSVKFWSTTFVSHSRGFFAFVFAAFLGDDGPAVLDCWGCGDCFGFVASGLRMGNWFRIWYCVPNGGIWLAFEVMEFVDDSEFGLDEDEEFGYKKWTGLRSRNLPDMKKMRPQREQNRGALCLPLKDV